MFKNQTKCPVYVFEIILNIKISEPKQSDIWAIFEIRAIQQPDPFLPNESKLVQYCDCDCICLHVRKLDCDYLYCKLTLTHDVI